MNTQKSESFTAMQNVHLEQYVTLNVAKYTNKSFDKNNFKF